MKFLNRLGLTVSTLLAVFFFTSGCASGRTAEDQINKEQSAEMRFENISPADALVLLENDLSVILLDVRTIEEHNELRIPDSLLIPYDAIEQKSSELLPDKDATILVYCRSGRRSVIAAESLVKLGYTNVRNLGGIIDWPYETISGAVTLR